MVLFEKLLLQNVVLLVSFMHYNEFSRDYNMTMKCFLYTKNINIFLYFVESQWGGAL